MKTWVMIIVMYTASAAVKLKPEKKHASTRFKTMTFAIVVHCSTN